jgi:hypothetical protein
VFSETRYALNGDLRVAYRASREGPRDIVFVPNWFMTCEVAPELPSIQGWLEAITSLGRLIFSDQRRCLEGWRVAVVGESARVDVPHIVWWGLVLFSPGGLLRGDVGDIECSFFLNAARAFGGAGSSSPRHQ